MTNQEIANELDKFPVEFTPIELIKTEYRAPTCFGCGRFIRKAFHIHYEAKGNHRELHLCRKCGEKRGLCVD
jgi:hypothetical protein